MMSKSLHIQRKARWLTVFTSTRKIIFLKITFNSESLKIRLYGVNIKNVSCYTGLQITKTFLPVVLFSFFFNNYPLSSIQNDNNYLFQFIFSRKTMAEKCSKVDQWSPLMVLIYLINGIFNGSV